MIAVKQLGGLNHWLKKITPARVIVAAYRKIALPCKTWRTFKPDLVFAFQFGCFPALWGDFPEASILKFQLFQSSQWVLLSNRNWWNTQNMELFVEEQGILHFATFNSLLFSCKLSFLKQKLLRYAIKTCNPTVELKLNIECSYSCYSLKGCFWSRRVAVGPTLWPCFYLLILWLSSKSLRSLSIFL